MHTLQFIITLAFLAIAGTIAATFYSQYRTTDPTCTRFQRLIRAAEGSATILWAKFVAVLAMVVGSIGDIGDALGQPEIRGYAETALGNPKIVAGILLSVSFVTIAARKRPSSLSPLQPPVQ